MVNMLYFSRGHGFGHASKDHEIVGALRTIVPVFNITIVSSGLGTEYFRNVSMDSTELEIPDDSDLSAEVYQTLDTYLQSCADASILPDIIVANEVFYVPLLARKFGVPSILITHWLFSSISNFDADYLLSMADWIILLDDLTGHSIPSFLTGKMTAVGPYAGELSVDRLESRRLLGLPESEMVAVIAPGSSRSDKVEDARMLIRRVSETFRILGSNDNHLIVMADPDVLAMESDIYSGLIWTGFTSTPDIYYQAADVVWTLGTFSTVAKVLKGGIPTIALRRNNNPVDEYHCDCFESKGMMTSVQADSCPDEYVAALQKALRQRPQLLKLAGQMKWSSPREVARQIVSLTNTLTSQR